MDKINRRKTNFIWHYIDILSCKIEKIADIYDRTIGKEYEKEIKAFNLIKHNEILHIGSGSYPISAMALAKIKNAKIVGIDRNPKSVVRARNLINRKNLDGCILIENENGFNYPMSGFDLIVVSGCSIPKIKVLKHVFKEAKPDSKIIVREGRNSINSTLDLINSYSDIEIVDEIICNPFPTMSWKSFYLEKNSIFL